MWWQESIAIVFLIASTIASFVTLYPYQNRPLPDWPYAITIGALLSVYSIVLRLTSAFLLAQGLAQLKWHWFANRNRPLYDLALHEDAMRGPVGALKLLAESRRLKGWQGLGCVLIILALLTGPFTQQVLHYEQCSWPMGTGLPDPRAATILRANVILGEGHHEGGGENTLTMSEQAAINTGIYAPGTVENVCASTNCTFPQYTTMGLCSQCDDVSNQVEITLLYNYTGIEDGFMETNISMLSAVPGGLSVLYTFDYANRQQPAQYAACGVTYYDTFSILIGLPGSPFDPATGSAYTDCDASDVNQSWRCRGYGAADCELVPCARTFQPQVVNGIFTEALVTVETDAFSDVSALSDWSDGTALRTALNTTCLDDSQRTALMNLGYNPDVTATWMPYGSSGRDHSSSTTVNQTALDLSLVQSGCFYGASQFFLGGLSLYMTDSLGGSLTGIDDFYGGGILSFDGPQILMNAYNFGDFSFERIGSLFDNISLSLSNELRSAPGVEEFFNVTIGGSLVNGTIEGGNTTFYNVSGVNYPAYGVAYTNKTCVHITWVWLIVPVALAALTLVCFAAALITSSGLREEIKGWKASSIPLLFYGPFSVRETDPFGPRIGSQEIGELDEVAQAVRVELVQDDEGISCMRRIKRRSSI